MKVSDGAHMTPLRFAGVMATAAVTVVASVIIHGFIKNRRDGRNHLKARQKAGAR